jgi:hypothetical protein
MQREELEVVRRRKSHGGALDLHDRRPRRACPQRSAVLLSAGGTWAGGGGRYPTGRPSLAVMSHLHADHLHVGSLSVLPHRVPVVVPRGPLRAVPDLRRLRDRELIEVAG